MREVAAPGRTVISNAALASIVGAATHEIEGVYALGESSVRRTLAEHLRQAEPRSRGVEVELGGEEAIANISFRIIYGYGIPSVSAKIRQNVAKKMRDLCGLDAREINVRVVSVYFPESPLTKLE